MTCTRTDIPVIADGPKITRAIAEFWDKTSAGFRMAWGPHIHHGFFERAGDAPLAAQEKLIDKLAALIRVAPGDKILDAGCGMGGSSLYLAKNYGAEVIGITLSRAQAGMAARAAAEAGIGGVSFKVEDALSMASFAAASFDLVWSLESCEQFCDKRRFLREAHRVLKPGGRLLLATWCTDADAYEGEAARKYRKLCAAFQLPYMPSIEHYARLLNEERLTVERILDWSAHVGKSWAVGPAGIGPLAALGIVAASGWRGMLFLKNARLMREGFETGRVRYGVFAARKHSS